MKKVNEILAVILLSLAAVLAAAIGFRTYDTYVNDKQAKREQQEQEQVLSRNREANERVLEMREEIQELSADRERLGQFLEELQMAEPEEVIPVSMMVEMSGEQPESGMTGGRQECGMAGELPEQEMTLMSEGVADTSQNMASVSENAVHDMENFEYNGENMTNTSDNMTGMSDDMMYVSDNIPSLSENDTISGNTLSLSGNDAVSENTLSLSGNDAVSENTLSLSGNDAVSENTLSLSGNDAVSENALSLSGNDAVSENTPNLSGNDAVSGNMTDLLPKIEMVYPETTLAERRQIRSSLEETLLINQEDQMCLEERHMDFADIKIACLGDSITAAANLEGQENYPACSYPAVLQELLGAEKVVNLGIGGSTIGRYWSNPFVERYREIPQDTDIIIVMGGTNDGFCLSEKEFGTLTERKPRTFCGDLDELMRGLKENYPQAAIYFVTPLPNILQDYLMRERSYLLPQSDLVNVMLTLAAEYDFRVIDLYNANLLDSHDADIVTNYIPDGVHANETGYRILAQHIAAEIVRQEEGATDTLQ